MMTKNAQPLDQLLRNCHSIRALRLRLQEQQRLLEQVRAALPAQLAPHCEAAVPSGGSLVLYAASPVWASRLRFFSRNLQRSLQGSLYREIRIRVSGPGIQHPTPARPPAAARPLSAENRRLIWSTAEGLRDPALRAALQRLAAHGEEDA